MSTAIALGVRGPQPGGGVTINPFEAMNTLSQIQQRQQSMQLQQREMLGQQRFGMILNQAPDLQTGINAAMNDPLAAPYAADSIMRLQAALQDQRNITTSIGKEATDGHEAILGAIASAPDPQTARQMAMQRFSILSPDAQKREWPAFSAALEGFTGGMEGMPADQAADQFAKNRAAIGVSLKWDPSTIRAATGMPAPFTQEVTGQGGVKYTVQVPTGLYPGQAVAPPMLYDPNTRTVHPAAIGVSAASPVGAPPPPTSGASTTGTPQATPIAAPGGDTTGGPDTVVSDAPPPAGGAPGPGPGGVVPPPGSGGLVAPPPGGMAPGFTRGPAPGAIDPLTPWTQQQQKEMEADVQRNSDMYKEEIHQINDAAAAIPMLSERMDFIQDMQRGFQGGPGTTLRAEGAAALRSMGSLVGFDQNKMNTLANKFLGGSSLEALADEQDFKALISSYAVQQLKEAALGTGRVMLPEVDTFMRAISADMDPLAIMRLINRQGRFGLQVGMDRINKFNGFVSGVRNGTLRDPQGHPYDIGNYLGWYAQNMPKSEKLPLTNQGGRYIGPRPEHDYFGGTQQGGYTVDPNTGALSPMTPGQPGQ